MKPFQHIPKYPLFLIAFALGLSLSGCIFYDKASATKQKEALEEKIKHFKSLQHAVINQSLAKGTIASRMRELYGEPDDIFSSGSTTGRFEIWSYEQISSGHDSDLHPIRLYFNDEKLVSWNY